MTYKRLYLLRSLLKKIVRENCNFVVLLLIGKKDDRDEGDILEVYQYKR